jgi:dienelactone hydrolase
VRTRTLLPLWLAALALGACGGAGSGASKVVRHGPTGAGALQAWAWSPQDHAARSVVIVLHGRGDTDPADMQAWIDHLVAGGHDVIFPRYERSLEDEQLGHVVEHVAAGVRQGMQLLGQPRLPVTVIGYSWGARLAFDYAAAARFLHAPAPRAILSVFPSGVAPGEQVAAFRGIDPATSVRIMVGDDDRVVAGGGAQRILGELEEAGFPPQQIAVQKVVSQGSFVASHGAPLDTSAHAHAIFWGAGDRMLSAANAG